ncbi:precorrin-2 dehydrogenase/sirohydrochlorin ferrochelatase family protein [Solidesulfovibrio magneticus]|uniref:precorrin-2 dehydrogenase n=1 Tax=Solidesulfovibrio magneticus (strain ATCC 700980 / DSM 13731 / RS-1) TaxID=573370 RepID=C4XPF4_SOLM1|nr:bifunctional precorrin-2 dehydrogenase/sirohydrochlorin ferrochelatase [Solidesulfovibrio magneticus]BAH75135.1 bifunctional precorrin-2 oxidase/chelatase family protein [Solidesulfovibrio magneticus RS-1]
MRYYPIYVNLRGKRCLVVGAGQVGRRKIATLAECGAEEILVIDLAAAEACAELLSHPAVVFACRPYETTDLDGRFLVIASTDDEALNWRISRECAERGIPCNIVDQPEKCSFIVPALFTQGDLTVAISTGGASPALARKIRQGLGEFLGSEYGALLILMSRLRPLVLGLGLGSPANSTLFRELVNSPLLEALEQADTARAETILRDILPATLHGEAAGLVAGALAHAGA